MRAARLGLALAGFAVGALAVGLDQPRIAWAAIALLLGSLILRVWEGRRGPPDPTL